MGVIESKALSGISEKIEKSPELTKQRLSELQKGQQLRSTTDITADNLSNITNKSNELLTNTKLALSQEQKSLLESLANIQAQGPVKLKIIQKQIGDALGIQIALDGKYGTQTHEAVRAYLGLNTADAMEQEKILTDFLEGEKEQTKVIQPEAQSERGGGGGVIPEKTTATKTEDAKSSEGGRFTDLWQRTKNKTSELWTATKSSISKMWGGIRNFFSGNKDKKPEQQQTAQTNTETTK